LRFAWPLIAIPALTLSGNAAFGDTDSAEPPVVSEREILVTATRREAALFDVPASASSVDGALATGTRLRRTFPDFLADLPSVMVQKTSYGQASPFIRGFTGYQTVMLVDGIRLNNANFRSGPNQYWSTIDPFSVDRTEVVRGTASVLYGSDAVGGAVNALARRRRNFEEGSHGSARSFTRWSSAEDSWTERVEVEGNVDNVGFVVGGTYRTFGDLKSGGSTDRMRPTGYRDASGDLRLDFRQNDGVTWTLGIQHMDQDDVPRHHKTESATKFHGTEPGTELIRELDQTRDLLYTRWTNEDLDAPFAERAEITVSWQRQRDRRFRQRDTSRVDVQGVDVSTFGLQAQFEQGTEYGFLTYGIEWWHDDVDSFRKDFRDGALDLVRVQGPVADDAAYDLVGVYVQDEIELGETTLIAGARYTHAAADADRVDNPLVAGADPATPGNVIGIDDSWNTVVGSLRAVQPLADRWNAFGGVSQAFRAPNLSDLTRLDATSGFETPSPDLDEENYLQFEIGLKGEGDGWSVQTSFWHTVIDGMIVPSPTGRVIEGAPEVRKSNVGDGWVQGIEVEGLLRLNEDWTLTGGLTWMNGEVDQIDDAGRTVRAPLSRLMPLTGTLTATYAPRGGGFEFWASGRAADDQDDLSLKDETDTTRIPPGGTPGYGVLSLGMRTRLSDGATLSVAIENVTDREYRVHGSGVNEPGRNLVLALDLVF